MRTEINKTKTTSVERVLIFQIENKRTPVDLYVKFIFFNTQYVNLETSYHLKNLKITLQRVWQAFTGTVAPV